MLVCSGKTSSSKLDDVAFMLRTWLRTIYSSFLDLSVWSEASALALTKSYKSQAHVSPILQYHIIPLHTKNFEDHNRPSHSILLQCFSTNPCSLSSPPSLWLPASPPRPQGNQAMTTTKYRAITATKYKAITKTPPIQHRPALRPPVPPFAARAPRPAATPSSLSPPSRLLSRLRSRPSTPP
jgi:hypothetical protein